MKLKTWVDNITDESNLWLEALKNDESENFFESIELYLDDAKNCLNQKSWVGAALSCSCAANCLFKMGNYEISRILYAEAGKIYEKYASEVISRSFREAMWTLLQATDHYILANDDKKFQEAKERFIHLKMKTDPFCDIDELRTKFNIRKEQFFIKSDYILKEKTLPQNIHTVVINFCKEHKIDINENFVEKLQIKEK